MLAHRTDEKGVLGDQVRRERVTAVKIWLGGQKSQKVFRLGTLRYMYTNASEQDDDECKEAVGARASLVVGRNARLVVSKADSSHTNTTR